MTFISVVRALYGYEAQDTDELNFNEDDLLCVLHQDESDPEWLHACLLKNQERTGMIPNNYVAPVEPMARIKALYSYQAQEDNEVGFDEGQVLELLAKLEDDWWLVRKDSTVYGLVPSNYFEETSVTKSSQIDIFSALLNAAETEDGQTPETAFIDANEKARWIDTVDIRHVWSGTLIVDKKKRKGEVIIGEDDVLGFVTGEFKTEQMKHKLVDISKYDKKKKVLVMKGTEEKISLELSKNHALLLEKEIIEAKERAENSKRIMRQEAALHDVEEIPELPDRGDVSSPKSPTSSVQARPLVLPKMTEPEESTVKAEGSMLTAMYSYEPTEEDELKIEEDEKLMLIDDSDSDWWLVQRLHGSQKKGLVPSSYVVKQDSYSGRFSGAGAEVVEEEAEVAQSPRSPKSPKSASRPGTPVVPGFLDELKKKTKARSPVAEPEEEITIEEQICKVENEENNETEEAPMEVADPVPIRSEPVFNVRVPPAPPLPKTEVHEVDERIETAEAYSIPVPPPLPKALSVEEPANLPEIKQPVAVVKELPRVEVVREAPKEKKKTEFALPKLKPVMKDESGFNALSNMLLRKQEDMRTMNKSPEAIQATTPVKIASPVQKEEAKSNPWKDLSMKKIASKAAPVQSKIAVEAAPMVIPPVAKALPSRPAQVAGDKPIPADTRLWTSKNGQFQVEAKYVGYQGGKVNLHKLNGNKISVPVEQLSERDKEFVYRQEGIPWDQGAKKDFRVGTFDWLEFFKDAGLEPRTSRAFAQICLDRKIGESFLMSSTNFSREYLLGMKMSEGDVIEVLRHANGIRGKKASEEGTRKTLEKIQAVKQENVQKRVQQQPIQPTPPQRRPSEAFASIELPVLHNLSLNPSPSQSKTIKDIPSIQPKTKNEPKVFSSTTITNQPAYNIPPNPLASYIIPNVPVQQVQSGIIQPQIPPQQISMQQQIPMQYQQQQMGLPNLQSNGRAYPQMNPQLNPQMNPQMMHHMNSHMNPQMNSQMAPQYQQQQYQQPQQFSGLQGPTVLGTTQYRTEYYGTQQPTYNMAPMQQAQMQQQLPSLQSLQGQPPKPNQGASGDKYSIFKYVDPNAPQLLNQAPPPPSNQQYPYGHGWQQ